MPARSIRTVGALQVPPLDDAPTRAQTCRDVFIGVRTYAEPSVKGTLKFSRVAWLGVGCIRAGGHRVVQKPRRGNRPKSAATHLLLQVSGMSVVEQEGRLLTLHRGHWTALPTDRSYTLTAPGHTERIMIVVPHKRLPFDLSKSGARSYSAISGASRLLYSVATCLVNQLGAIRAVHAPALATHLGGLIQVALEAAPSQESCEDDNTRQGKLRRYILQHLRDPELTIERIASDLRCSTRTLTRMFVGRGETLNNQIYRERLEGASNDLRHPSLRARSLEEIARSWGFRNYSHFSDRFHRHFGVTPAAARMQGVTAHATEGEI
jgi:AraC-like DNA-binding protein